MNERQVRRAVRDGITRSAAAIGLLGVALIHLLDLPGKFGEVPYMAWMYVGLIVACFGVAGMLIGAGDARAWTATLVLPALVVTGFVLSRTTGLPQAHDDVGNWGEPLGIASMFVEGSLIALAGSVLAERIALAPQRRLEAVVQP